MNKYFTQSMQIINGCLDVFTLNTIFIFSSLFIPGLASSENSRNYFDFVLLLNFSWVFFCLLGEVYSSKHIISFELFSRRTSRIYLIWLIAITLYLLFTKSLELPKLYVVTNSVIFGMSLLLNRFFYLGIQNFLKKRKHFSENIIIIGYNQVAKKLARNLEIEHTRTEIVGFCEERANVTELSNYPIISSINNAIEVSKRYGVTEIYSTISPEQDFRISQLMKEADKLCIRFKLIPDLSHFIKVPFHVSYLNEMPILFFRSEPLADLMNQFKKRVFDVIFSLLVILFVLSWLFPLVALLIKLTGKGPVLYVQNRLGRNNKIFKVFKFRTMSVTDSDDQFIAASKEDTRITKLGKLLRKTSLDEMPQFLNVLSGHMSINGPRPHPLKLNDSYREIVETYMVRHFLKPGITGWAQVNGFRGEVVSVDQMEGRIKFDIWYMENWNLWLDVKIIFMTIYNIFKGEKNAY